MAKRLILLSLLSAAFADINSWVAIDATVTKTVARTAYVCPCDGSTSYGTEWELWKDDKTWTSKYSTTSTESTSSTLTTTSTASETNTTSSSLSTTSTTTSAASSTSSSTTASTISSTTSTTTSSTTSSSSSSTTSSSSSSSSSSSTTSSSTTSSSTTAAATCTLASQTFRIQATDTYGTVFTLNNGNLDPSQVYARANQLTLYVLLGSSIVTAGNPALSSAQRNTDQNKFYMESSLTAAQNGDSAATSVIDGDCSIVFSVGGSIVYVRYLQATGEVSFTNSPVLSPYVLLNLRAIALAS